MTVEANRAPWIAAVEEAIRDLRDGGIEAVQIEADGEEIRELHILSSSRRPAKGIVRDVQTLLRTRFHRSIDHRVISVAYYALLRQPPAVAAATDAADARWFPLRELPPLAFDHAEILDYARLRLRYKVEYTNVVYSLLPDTFTLSELQRVYEVILGRALDKRNFRKKILSLDLVEPTGGERRDGAHRPARLYRFRSREPMIVEVF